MLKKLSRQHLMSHVLPVLVSLKHALEAAKSRLQVSLSHLSVSLSLRVSVSISSSLLSFHPLKLGLFLL